MLKGVMEIGSLLTNTQGKHRGTIDRSTSAQSEGSQESVRMLKREIRSVQISFAPDRAVASSVLFLFPKRKRHSATVKMIRCA